MNFIISLFLKNLYKQVCFRCLQMSEIQYLQNLKTLNDIFKSLEYFRKFETLLKDLELQ